MILLIVLFIASVIYALVVAQLIPEMDSAIQVFCVLLWPVLFIVLLIKEVYALIKERFDERRSNKV